MSPKRELSAEAGSNEERSPPSTPKKKTKTSASTPKTKSPAASGAWDASSKSALVRRLVETGYKHMDWKALAEETGMSEAACKNQLTPGRANIRKVVQETFL